MVALCEEMLALCGVGRCANGVVRGIFVKDDGPYGDIDACRARQPH
jgi:hypothetical protein